MNAAATFRTFGHFKRAITVNRFPQMPTIIMIIVVAAAKFSNGRPNLELGNKKKTFQNHKVDLTSTAMQRKKNEKDEVKKANKRNGGLIWQNWYAGFYDVIHGAMSARVNIKAISYRIEIE